MICCDDTFRHAVFVNQHLSYESICEQDQVVGGLGLWDRKPRRREERPNIAAMGAIPAVMASKMTVVINRRLRATVRQIREPNLFCSLLDDGVKTAPGNRRLLNPGNVPATEAMPM